jgi:hypothetical protein
MPHFPDSIPGETEWSGFVKRKPKSSESPLDRHTVEELQLQERLIIKYIEEGMTREEAALQALADLRERRTSDEK